MAERRVQVIIGKNLARIRKRQEANQSKLAKAVGVSRATYSSWENGHTCPDSSQLIALSKQLNCSITELLDQDPDGRELLFLAFRCEMEHLR